MSNKIPKTPNIKKWESYLNRKLNIKEKRLFINTKNEIELNKIIMDLIINLKDSDLYIPKLTFSDGNCLYESIIYHIPDITIKELRKTLANFMYLYKNYKNIFTNNDLTLMDMFIMQNEIEYLFDKKNDVVYNYNFDVMCADLSCDGSWQRLPIEIILMCVSFIFDIKITICHDNGYTHDIVSCEKPERTIYLGLLGEFHYIPLNKKKLTDSDDITDNILVYNNYIDDFDKWRNKFVKDLE